MENILNFEEQPQQEQRSEELVKLLVVIPHYNHSEYIADSVRSVLASSFSNLKVVVVDDASSDEHQQRFIEELAPLQAIDSRLIVQVRESNGGRWKVLNDAISEHIGDCSFFAIQDADDECTRDRFECQLASMFYSSTNNNFPVMHCLTGFQHIFSQQEMEAHRDDKFMNESLGFIDTNDTTQLAYTSYAKNGGNFLETLDFETAGSSAMFHRHVWEIGFRFNPPNMGLRLSPGDDTDMNLRVMLSLKSSIIVLAKPYLYRRGTTTSILSM